MSETHDTPTFSAPTPIVVGITLGDVHGIGPELAIRIFAHEDMLNLCTPVLFGPADVLAYYRNALNAKSFHVSHPKQVGKYPPGKVYLMDTSPDYGEPQPGTPSPRAGRAAAAALEEAVKQLDVGMIDVLVTLPIDKASIQSDSFPYPGHTEFLQDRLGARGNLMFMVSDWLKVAVATNHLPLEEVARRLTKEGILQKIEAMHQSLRLDFGLEKPRIAVLGLNPHAGDGGLLGKEEKDVIKPALEAAKKAGIFAIGPYPADGFFANHAYRKFDAVLAMYHDQGLIPFKTLAGHEGINFTAGLSAIRTSPDHGTAYDLAGKGEADLSSARAAIFWAIDLYRQRRENLALAQGALKTGAAAGLIAPESP